MLAYTSKESGLGERDSQILKYHFIEMANKFRANVVVGWRVRVSNVANRRPPSVSAYTSRMWRSLVEPCSTCALPVCLDRPCNDMPQCCCRRSALLVALQFTSSFFLLFAICLRSVSRDAVDHKILLQN